MSQGKTKNTPSEWFLTFLMIFQNWSQVAVVCTQYLARPHIANFGISLNVFFVFFRFGFFFLFLIFFGCFVVLVHPTVVLVLISASVKRFDVSRMRDFFSQLWHSCSMTPRTSDIWLWSPFESKHQNHIIMFKRSLRKSWLEI